MEHSQNEIESGVRVTHNEKQHRLFVPDGVQLHFVVLHQLAHFPDVKGGQTCAAAYQDRGTGFASGKQKFLILPHSKMVGVFLLQSFKHQVYGALKLRVVLAGFTGIYHFQQRCEVHFLCRGLIPDVTDQGRVKQPF